MTWNRPKDADDDSSRNNAGSGEDPKNESGKQNSGSGWDDGSSSFDFGGLGSKIADLFRGGSGGSGGGSSGGSHLLLIAGIAAVLLVVIIFSGFYTVKEAERGVLLRLGRFDRLVQPGLSWKIPFVDKVILVDVSTVKSLNSTGLMLTQDENVVRVEINVQYRVSDAYKYLFSTTNADESVGQAIDSAMRYVVGHNTMDDVLTTGREKVQDDTARVLNEIIKPYDMGISVVAVNFLPAHAPEEVKEAFDDAISAQEDEQRFIREAEAYEREIIPKAEGRVQRIKQDANAYKDKVVLGAKGDVAGFERVLPEYLKAPEITRKRIYLETMSDVLSHTANVYVSPSAEGSMLYLPLDGVFSGKDKKDQSSSGPTRDEKLRSSAAALSMNGQGEPDYAAGSSSAGSSSEESYSSGIRSGIRSSVRDGRRN